MFGSKRQIVVTEPDVQAAVAHLRSLPFMPKAPKQWDRKRFIDQLAASVAKAKIVECIAVAPGVWAIIKPFGGDLFSATGETDGRLQAWLCVRAWGTDPTQVTVLI